MSTTARIPGKFVWYEILTSDPKRAQTFYSEVFGWKHRAFPMGDFSYDMILTGESLDSMIGGYGRLSTGQPPHWIGYASVEDVDVAAKAAIYGGGRIVHRPTDIPNVGRFARIADPAGAELCVMTRSAGDAPDVEDPPVGIFCWNELHTPEPEKAVAFYEKVVGYTHKTQNMGGDAGDYHILGRGGVDRAGVTHHLPPGTPPHWLPYVYVDDADATTARALTNGGKSVMGPFDIPNIGRFCVVADPTGAVIAALKPLPRAKA